MREHLPLAALLKNKARQLVSVLPITALLTVIGLQPAYSQTDQSKKMAALTVINMLLLDSCRDEDKDTLCDDDEIKYFGDITSVNDANADEDGDGLSNGRELNFYHSDPTSTNTDGDALGDFAEALIGTSLTVPFNNGGTLGGDSVADKAKMHKLNRLTFGPTQTELDQVIAAGGIDDWIADQLIPIGLPPAPPRNTNAVAPLYGGNDDIYPLPYDCSTHVTPDPAQAMRDCYVTRGQGDVDIVASFRPVHSIRQLQSRMAMFWDNHFNTDLSSHGGGLQELFDEDNWFINAFGSFRTLLELNAKNYTMLEYLDLDDNRRTSPNENFPREIMELHSLGIDGGYTDLDIAQLAYILTGWDHDDVRDLGLCTDETNIISCGQYVSRYAYVSHANNDVGNGGSGQTGLENSARFNPLEIFTFKINDHDDGQADYDGDGIENSFKVLYEGTPFKRTIVSLQGAAGEQEGEEALDFLAEHPATADFICKKLAQEFVSDTPQATTLANCASTFLANTSANDQIGKVLANLLASAEFNSPANQQVKLKDTQEVMFSLGRLLGWDASHQGAEIEYYSSLAALIDDAEQPMFYKAEPTGYYETAENWLDTNIVLNRFQEMNDMVLVYNSQVNQGRDQTQSFVDYFKSIGKTRSGPIMAHLFSLMLGGHYDEHDVQMGLDMLHKVDPDNAGNTALQAFDINNTDDFLRSNLSSSSSNGTNGLVDPEDRIRALVARLAALPAFQLH